MRGPLPSYRPSSHRHSWAGGTIAGKDGAVPVAATGRPGCARLNNRWCPTARRRSGCSSIRVRCAVATPLGHGTFPSTISPAGPQARFFPLWTMPSSRRSPASSSRNLAPLSRQSLADLTARAAPRWAHRSVAARCGGFSIPMPSNLGGTNTGFFLVIPTSPSRPARFWTSMRACGTAQPLGPKDHILSADEKTSIQARRRCHPALPPAPGRAAASSTNTSAVGPCNIWRPGTCAGGMS